MAEYGSLFWIILFVLALITICLFLIVYTIIKGEKEREKLHAMRIAEAEKIKAHKCPHFLGYLAEQPRHNPIPEECFCCIVAMDCITMVSADTNNQANREDKEAHKN